MNPQAKVIADSVAPGGSRLTTMEVTMHRFVLAEFNTHRVFSRNSASSRAIPVRKQIERIEKDLAYPVSWPLEQPGMQGGSEIEDFTVAIDVWNSAAEMAIRHARALVDLGIHKSVVNRLLEPFMWHTVIVSSTEWVNFFHQRRSPLAQPEIRMAADAMWEAYTHSTPRVLRPGAWHLPYIDPMVDVGLDLHAARKVSAARCARVSYLTHDGKRDIEEDIKLFERLVSADPGHWSPLEHVATPLRDQPILGNFPGWHQLRHQYEYGEIDPR